MKIQEGQQKNVGGHSEEFKLSSVSKNRLEFLFDGIFAIAMTILVLELKIPDLANYQSTGELWQGLLHQGPTFLSYLLSLMMLGMFWYRHNQQYRYYQTINRRMLAIHFLQLGLAAFFPFCAALIGRYPSNPLSMLIYSGCVMGYLWGSLAQWLVAHRAGVFVPNMEESEYRRKRKRYITGSLLVTFIFLIYLSKILM